VPPSISYEKKVTDSTAKLLIDITNKNEYQMDIRWIDFTLLGSVKTGQEREVGSVVFSTGNTKVGTRLPFGAISVSVGENIEVTTEGSDDLYHIPPRSTGYFEIEVCRTATQKADQRKDPQGVQFSKAQMTMPSMSKAAALETEMKIPVVLVSMSIKNPHDDQSDHDVVQEVRIANPDALPECPSTMVDDNEERQKALELICLRNPICDYDAYLESKGWQ
jgi:hypothetical protein